MISNKFSKVAMAAALVISFGAVGIASAADGSDNGRGPGMQTQMQQGGMHTMLKAERDTFNDSHYRGGMQGNRNHMNMNRGHNNQQKDHRGGYQNERRGGWGGDHRMGSHMNNRGHQNNYMGNHRGNWNR